MNRLLFLLLLAFAWNTASAATADDVECSQCVDADDLAPDSISSGKLSNQSITRNKLQDSAVRERHISGSSIIQGKFKDGAVTTRKIRDGNVTDDKLAPEVQTLISDLHTEIEDLASQIAALEAYIEVDETTSPSQPVVRIVGANLQVVNGADGTDTVNGTGNVIVGYNEIEEEGPENCTDGSYQDESTCESNGETWGQFHRVGSHNLVVGPNQSYSQYGGLIAGFGNAINRQAASSSSGRFNVSSGRYASVTAGYLSYATAELSAVTAGSGNRASGITANAVGGAGNTASGMDSTVSGGSSRSVAGQYNWAAGSLLETN